MTRPGTWKVRRTLCWWPRSGDAMLAGRAVSVPSKCSVRALAAGNAACASWSSAGADVRSMAANSSSLSSSAKGTCVCRTCSGLVAPGIAITWSSRASSQASAT